MSSTSTTRAAVHASIAALTTNDLADSLLNELDELTRRFDLGDFQPSELNGGRFAEAAFRICEFVCTGTHTPIGRTLPRVDQLLRTLEQTSAATADDSFRLHIPRSLRLIYDLRNKRDVAHLGVGVSPNFADASLILACASWVTAEIVRISHQCDITMAQTIVDNLVQRRTSLIWTEDDIVRVLDPSLSYRDKVLLILYDLQPDWVEESKLFGWVEYSNMTQFRRSVLGKLHDDALIHYADGSARILPPGNTYVEEHIRSCGP